jgi:hypothetical protein
MCVQFSLRFLVALHLITQQAECSVATEKGPPHRKKALETVLARHGEDVRMVCPVYGSPQPIIEWSKVCCVHYGL